MTSPSARPKATSLRPLRSLLPFLRPYLPMLLGALVALLVAAAAMLAWPVSLRMVIDRGMAGGNAQVINRYFGWFLGASVAFGIFAALRFYLVTWLGERVVADLRQAVYRRVIRMDPAFFEVTRTGEVLSRLTADATLVQTIAGVNLSITLRSIINLVGALVMLFITSPRLTLVILIIIPVVIVPLIVVGRRVRRMSRDAQDRIADSSSLVDETLNAVQTVQAFNLEQMQSERFADAVERSFRAAIRRSRVRAWLTAIGTALVFGGVTYVLWLGAHAVQGGSMSAGQLGQFLIYAAMVGTAAASLTEMWGEIQRAAGGMERLSELLAAQPGVIAQAPILELPRPGKGEIRFESASFHYPTRPGIAALNDFSLLVAPGQTVALVGPSGAGKSTLFQLLLRFRDPDHGRILIDNVDIAHVQPAAVREILGLVAQETVLFGASVRENIAYGRPTATEAEIVAAAQAAAAEEFIRELPQGYDTFLGERGVRLSGGQRQRIAIARAILKNPPILLLDEATSALDAQSERLVQTAITGLMRQRTTLVIAHRLATVLAADRIVVMERGSIVASGRHDELLQSSPLYARLAQLQFTDGKGAGA